MGMGGGGGDGGAAERKAAEDKRQAEAIARLNRSFGINSEQGPAPTREAFLKASDRQVLVNRSPFANTTEASWDNFEPEFRAAEYDDAGFERQLAQYQNEGTEADTQRAAREQLYGKVAQDAKSLQLADLTKDRSIAERDVSFDLARRGLTGGSRQIDAGRDITDQFNRGVLTAENNAQDVANRARQGDEKTRVNLLSGIRSGMSEADAVTAALTGMSNTAQQAASEARSQNVGGFFDAIRNAANSRAEEDGYKKAFEKYRTGGGSGGGSYGGNVSSV